jgi:hypothetical protein
VRPSPLEIDGRHDGVGAGIAFWAVSGRGTPSADSLPADVSLLAWSRLRRDEAGRPRRSARRWGQFDEPILAGSRLTQQEAVAVPSATPRRAPRRRRAPRLTREPVLASGVP